MRIKTKMAERSKNDILSILQLLMLYTHISTYTCRIHIGAMIKKSEDFFKKNMPLTLFVRLCVWEGVGDRTKLQYIDPHSYGHQRCVFLVLQGGSTGGLGAQPLWDMFSFQYLVLNSSDLQLTDFLSTPSYIIVQSPTQYLPITFHRKYVTSAVFGMVRLIVFERK